MRIRFYCPFCDQLLGVSRQKVGSAITCPACRGVVGVPPEKGTAKGSPAPPLIPVPRPPVARMEAADPVLGPVQIAILGMVLVGLLAAAFLAGVVAGALL